MKLPHSKPPPAAWVRPQSSEHRWGLPRTPWKVKQLQYFHRVLSWAGNMTYSYIYISYIYENIPFCSQEAKTNCSLILKLRPSNVNFNLWGWGMGVAWGFIGLSSLNTERGGVSNYNYNAKTNKQTKPLFWCLSSWLVSMATFPPVSATKLQRPRQKHFSKSQPSLYCVPHVSMA